MANKIKINKFVQDLAGQDYVDFVQKVKEFQKKGGYSVALANEIDKTREDLWNKVMRTYNGVAHESGISSTYKNWEQDGLYKKIPLGKATLIHSIQDMFEDKYFNSAAENTLNVNLADPTKPKDLVNAVNDFKISSGLFKVKGYKTKFNRDSGYLDTDLLNKIENKEDLYKFFKDVVDVKKEMKYFK